jgi:hypothetical protein
MSKNSPNAQKINCKPLSKLMELIEKDLDFMEELKEFESPFEWDEFLDILFYL